METERRLLSVRAREAVQAAEHALARRTGSVANAIRREVATLDVRAQQLDRDIRRRFSPEIDAADGSAGGPPARPLAGQLGSWARRVAVVAVVAVLVGAAAGLSQAWRRDQPTTAVNVAASSAPPTEGGIAASRASPSASEAPAEVPAAEDSALTFDDAATGAPPGAGWSSTGPAGAVSIAPYPTAVDRSVRLVAGDVPVSLCHRVEPTAGSASAAMSVLVERSIAPGVVVLSLSSSEGEASLRTTETDELALVGPDGATTLVAPMSPDAWYRATLTASADETRASISQNGEPIGEAAVAGLQLTDPQVCFSVPGGSGAEMYVNDVELAAGGGAGL